MFVSMLFSGCISDKDICKASGLYSDMTKLIEEGMIHRGDAIMVDMGFLIEEEVGEMGLKLIIPPFSKSACQMSAENVTKTNMIAKHRIVVENAIGSAKQFRILKGTVNLQLFAIIDQIWFCC